jgi:diaminopimelate epimerase
MELRFYKLRVCDADLILVDDLAGDGRDRDWSAAARLLLDRRRGAGADRLAVLAKAEVATWLRVFKSDGEPSLCPYDAALCAARFLLDSGRADSAAVRLRLPGGELGVDVLDAATLGISLGLPRGLPDGTALDIEAAAGRRAVVESGGERYEVLPLGLGNPDGGPEAVAVFYEGGAKAARARIRASTRGKKAPEVLPLRLVSREEIWVDAPRRAGLDAASIAGLSLAAAAAAGYAERGALVRLRGGALWTEWGEERPLYAAGRVEYVYRGEFHLEDTSPTEPSV